MVRKNLIWVYSILIGILIISGLNLVSADITTDIVAHYKLDESSGAVIDSVGGTSGTNNGATTGATGKIDDAYDFEFDDDDYVGTNVVLLPTNGDPFTINAWVKPESLTMQHVIVGQYFNAQDGRSGFIIDQNGDVGAFIGGTNGVNWYASTDIGVNTWHMLTWTRDSSGNFKVYINGSQVGTTQTGVTRGLYNGNTAIGEFSGDYNNHFDGIIDEVGIWDAELTTSEIQNLYNNGNGLEYPFINPDNAPIINSLSPANNSQLAYPNVDFSASVSDDINLVNVSLLIDGVIDQTNTSGYNGTTYTFSKALTNGVHNWSIIAYDNNSQSTESETRIINITIIPPEITELLPTANKYTKEAFNMFYALVTDNLGVENVSLWVDGSRVSTSYSGFNNTNYSFQTTLSEGTHTWYIEAYDNDSFSSTSATRTLIVDQTLPTFNEYAPNGSATYMQILRNEVIFNWSSTDTNSGSCYYNYNGTNNSINCTGNVSLPSQYTNLTFYHEDLAGNVLEKLVNWTVIDSSFTFYVWDYLGELVSSVLVTGDISYNGNPFSSLVSNFLNDTTNNTNITLNIMDQTYRNQDENFTVNVNISSEEYNITLDPNQLYLTFNQHGLPYNTQGEVCDTNMCYRFENSSVMIIQQNLSNGYVKTVFNMVNYTNWSQYYEYVNDYETHITEDLDILVNYDFLAYFEVTDMADAPITDAVIRVETNNASLLLQTPYNLIGQRLTQPNGKTFFYFDEQQQVLITVTKDGYEPAILSMRIGDENAFDEDNTIKIRLLDSDDAVINNVWVNCPKWFEDRSEDIRCVIMAKGRDQVKINTDWRESLGLSSKQLTAENQLGLYYFNLSSTLNRDFQLTGTGDIELKVYIDGNNLNNYTIKYDDGTNNIFNLPTFDEDIIITLGAIMLVLISSLVGYILVSVSSGFITFMIGAILMSTINVGFLWLSLVSVIYFVLQIIKKVYKE